jgi:hypothetical protein
MSRHINNVKQSIIPPLNGLVDVNILKLSKYK